MPIICPYCSSTISRGVKFCANCGCDVIPVETTALDEQGDHNDQSMQDDELDSCAHMID
ncbi:MAG: hypothetical protein ABIH21_00920 [Patescibacteria group bacterium]